MYPPADRVFPLVGTIRASPSGGAEHHTMDDSVRSLIRPCSAAWWIGGRKDIKWNHARHHFDDDEMRPSVLHGDS